MASAVQELTGCKGDRKASPLTVRLRDDASCKGACAVRVHRGGGSSSRECVVCVHVHMCVMVGREGFSEKRGI